MVDDEVLCHALGGDKTIVLLDQSQRKIDAGRDARRSPDVAVSTEDAICLNPDGWVLSLKARCISPGRRATTHWRYAARLQREYPSIRVEADRIFCRDGNVWTSAGIKAGYDLSMTFLSEGHDV